MKIGILTFHEVFNPGAFLQTLGTQTLLTRLGHEAWVINYNSPSHRFRPSKYIWRWHVWTLIFFPKLIEMIRKDRAFEAARQRLLNRTQHYLEREKLADERFDAVVIGADVVWDFQTPGFGRDPVYFGHGLNTDRLISFAASCGDCNIHSDIPSYVSEGLSRFHAISVRDETTGALVRNCAGVEPTRLCDPAFHLKLDDIMSSARKRMPYMVVYLRGNAMSDHLVDEVRRFAKQRKLRIVATYYTHRWADENLVSIEPTEWLSVLRDAEYVVTNTFHGSVFSAILEKRFAVEFNPGIRSKTEGMICEMGLEDRVIHSPGGLESILSHDIDYATAIAYRKKESERAVSFISNALE